VLHCDFPRPAPVCKSPAGWAQRRLVEGSCAGVLTLLGLVSMAGSAPPRGAGLPVATPARGRPVAASLSGLGPPSRPRLGPQRRCQNPGHPLAAPVALVDGQLAPAPGPESADGWALSSLGGNVGNRIGYRLPVT